MTRPPSKASKSQPAASPLHSAGVAVGCARLSGKWGCSACSRLLAGPSPRSLTGLPSLPCRCRCHCPAALSSLFRAAQFEEMQKRAGTYQVVVIEGGWRGLGEWVEWLGGAACLWSIGGQSLGLWVGRADGRAGRKARRACLSAPSCATPLLGSSAQTPPPPPALGSHTPQPPHTPITPPPHTRPACRPGQGPDHRHSHACGGAQVHPGVQQVRAH
jgi:hypothetical protein